MKLTKYEHACFTLEKDGKLLVVDPGGYTTDLPALENVVAVIVTHEHPDHFDVSALGAIVARNPDTILYAPDSITRQLGDTMSYKTVSAGQTIKAAPYTLEFFGGDHATIHSDLPLVTNLGVMVNDSLYYPGDSFIQPHKTVNVLALPTAAPWMKMSEAFDFLLAVKPKLTFPTHDAISSEAGKELADRMTPLFAEKIDATYQRIKESIEIDG